MLVVVRHWRNGELLEGVFVGMWRFALGPEP